MDNNVSNNNRCGICLYYPTNNTISNNIAKFNNEYGIYVGDGLKNIISNNICEGNGDGVGLIDTYIQGYDDIDTFVLDNAVINNTCKNNTGFGITLRGCLNNTILSNLCENNKWGIGLEDPMNNTLYHNNLINNTQNAYDTSTNQWDSGSAGNYYSDYNSIDNNTDGIGDDPHPIPGGTSTDRFPLMHPWTGDTPQKGDLNHDNQITPADAAIALQLAATGDGHVTSLDALMILQAAAGRIEL